MKIWPNCKVDKVENSKDWKLDKIKNSIKMNVRQIENWMKLKIRKNSKNLKKWNFDEIENWSKLRKQWNWNSTKLNVRQNWILDKIEKFEINFTSEQLRVFLNSKQSSEFSQSFQSKSQFFLSWMVKSHISLFINLGHPHFGDLSWSSALGSNRLSPSGARKNREILFTI